MLQLRVAGVAFDFGVDQLFFLLVDATVSLGCRDQCAQYRMAVAFGFGARQLIDRTHGLLRGGCLAALPALIGLERHHAQRRQRGIIGATRRAALGRAKRAAATQKPAQ